MPHIAHPALLVAGLAVLAVSYLVSRWTGRHDLKGLAFDSAVQVALGRRKDGRQTAIEQTFGEVLTEETRTGKARRAAGMGVRFFLAQLLGTAALIGMLCGVAMMAAGIWWR